MSNGMSRLLQYWGMFIVQLGKLELFREQSGDHGSISPWMFDDSFKNYAKIFRSSKILLTK